MRLASNIVFDASAYVRATQKNRLAVEHLRAFAYGGTRLHAPPHFHLEVGNAFRNLVRGRQSTPDDARLAHGAVLQMRIEIDIDPQLAAEALDFALSHGITVYDAAYVVLATRRGATPAAADSGLAQAARAAGVAVMLIEEPTS